jgi:hypothetical protein
VVPYW